MSEQESASAASAAPQGQSSSWIDAEALEVPYFDFAAQQEIAWRDDDIVISVPVKSGTTWTMNIVHQLRSGGDPNFNDIYVEVPWLELRPGRDVSHVEFVKRIDSMPDDRRRAFKTHCGPGPLPYQSADSGVRYIVVLRSPDEVLASFYPFMQSVLPGWYEYWDVDSSVFDMPDIKYCFENFGKMMLPEGLFGFLSTWWPLRNEPNVMLIHFSDMKRDHEGSVRKIADFLGFSPTAEQWPKILEYTSFPWMKQHGDKFDARLASAVPMLMPGAMVRKGKTGAAREDGVTREMAAELRALGEKLLTDREALDWLYSGSNG
jgi:hypothetical protein